MKPARFLVTGASGYLGSHIMHLCDPAEAIGIYHTHRSPEDGCTYLQVDLSVNGGKNRATFEDLRIKRDRAAERSSFMLAGIVANHVISSIHALWVGKKINKKSASQLQKFRFGWENDRGENGGRLRVIYHF